MTHFGLHEARAYANSLLTTLNIIADNSELGRLHDNLRPPARIHPHRNHILMYVLEQDRVPLVTQILAARQNWKPGDTEPA